MCELDTPNAIELPFITLLSVIVARLAEQDRAELWRAYMANIVPMWGGSDTKKYAEVVEAYEEATKPPKKVDTTEAERNARACSEAFEKLRG